MSAILARVARAIRPSVNRYPVSFRIVANKNNNVWVNLKSTIRFLSSVKTTPAVKNTSKSASLSKKTNKTKKRARRVGRPAKSENVRAKKAIMRSYSLLKAPNPKPIGPYAAFTKEFHIKISDMIKEKKLRGSEILPMVAQAWGQLTDAQKEEYREKAKKESAAKKKAYELWYLSTDQELIQLENRRRKAKNAKSTDGDKKKVELLKNPLLPKRPPTVFALFYAEMHNQLVDKTKTGKEQIIAVHEGWKNLPESEKQIYKDRFKENMKEYHEKVAAIKAEME
ncbi:Transcription factor A, mitochondrial [Zancudomyces culisetae]|uniref:Transcription factor A, mitochondrial n=1 Tax=Zancudomyces culisetae TaxID=1213189 RepID=A0A1R1PX46_ZANCU|nr:Transcription factor A, mitochondrial [Zancudomyces culisetae]|eukprot:OMH85492.1 Transcription factor A, mitochondrial [Zancudomyces culisetae]